MAPAPHKATMELRLPARAAKCNAVCAPAVNSCDGHGVSKAAREGSMALAVRQAQVGGECSRAVQDAQVGAGSSSRAARYKHRKTQARQQ